MGELRQDEDRQAALRLARQAHQVGFASGRQLRRAALGWVRRGRWGRRRGWKVVPELGTPWQDTVSGERDGWRERRANLRGDVAFAVDYLICRRCRLGWVEQPYTEPPYQRCGLATAGLAQLRTEHPGLHWHTAGGHMIDSRGFWNAVGADVPGGYLQRALCPHLGD